MSKPKAKLEFDDPTKRGPILSVRSVLAVLLVAAGIAYVIVWTLYLHDHHDWEFAVDPGKEPDTLIPGMEKLKDWNWAIGFGAMFLGLILAAHPTTPLGRGRGIVIGMLGCFIIGLIWICTFYVFANKAQFSDGSIWLLSDLGQLNLIVGIGFMAVGFTFATRWE